MNPNRDYKPLEVIVDEERGGIEKALKILKRLVNEDHVLQVVRAHQSYEKPSDKRRRKARQSIRRRAKALALKGGGRS